MRSQRTAIAALIVFAGGASCAPALPSVGRGEATSASAGDPWRATVTTGALARDSRELEMGAVLAPATTAPRGKLDVGGAVDLAMRNEPRMRGAWLRARAAAARLGVSKAGYYPQVDVGATGSYVHQTAQGGRVSFTQGTVGPYAKLSWLLLDFGARAANEDAEMAAVVAANGVHGAAIQDHVLAVVDAYYRCVSAEALVRAADADVQSAKLSLDAATALHSAGKADLGDVLQAQTALSRARIAHSSVQGQAQVMRGSLAAQLGLTPDAEIELVALADDMDAGAVAEDAGRLLERALRTRPDLLAAKAAAAAAWQRAQATKHRGKPTLTLDASASRGYFIPQDNATHGDNWGASLTFNVPVFTGFADSYEQQRAEWEALAVEADAQTLERRIALEVWTAYLQLRTSAEQVGEASALLATSVKWEQLARGRYEAGVGTILDLMAAQSTLASARSRFVQARADWLLARVQLAHDAGELGRRTVADLHEGVSGRGPRSAAPAATSGGSSPSLTKSR